MLIFENFEIGGASKKYFKDEPIEKKTENKTEKFLIQFLLKWSTCASGQCL